MTIKWYCKSKTRLDKNIKKADGVVGRRQESIDTAYRRLVTDKLRTVLADKTHLLRPEFDNRHVDRSHRFRIPPSKTTRYLQSFIPTAIGTHNQQAGRQTQHVTATDGDAGTTSGDKMEERLGVNRTVAVCVSGL